ncbi:hypothetical protein AAZX31_01G004700 [Glycine max]
MSTTKAFKMLRKGTCSNCQLSLQSCQFIFHRNRASRWSPGRDQQCGCRSCSCWMKLSSLQFF